MAGIMESGPGLLHIRRCHGVVGRTQGEPAYVCDSALYGQMTTSATFTYQLSCSVRNSTRRLAVAYILNELI